MRTTSRRSAPRRFKDDPEEGPILAHRGQRCRLRFAHVQVPVAVTARTKHALNKKEAQAAQGMPPLRDDSAATGITQPPSR